MLIPQGGLVGLAVHAKEVARLLPNSFSPVIQDVLAIASLLGVLYGLFRIARKIDRYAEYLDKQMQNNDGKSFRDAIDRTDLRVAELNDRFDDVDIYMRKLNGKLNAVDEKLSQHMADVKDNGEAS